MKMTRLGMSDVTRVLGIAAAGCLCVVPAHAITINLVYNPLGAPASDPTGAGLTSIAQAAAAMWEDIIEDPWTIDITYSYTSLSGNTLAQGDMTSTLIGKPTAGYFNVDNDTTWWIDPSPMNSSEYDLVTTTYDQLSASNQSAWYNGSVPALLEASYRGTGNTTASQNGLDMLSTVFHEMGHILGLSDPLASAETFFDFEYDVNSAFVGGQTMAIRTTGTDTSDVNSYGHIAAQALMCSGCGATGVRRLAGATDVFAIASASNWVLIDLPNKYLIGPSYSSASGWIGNRVPDSQDNVYLRTGGAITMSANGLAGTLSLTDNTLLLTGANLLNVSSRVDLGGDGAGEVIIGTGGELQATLVEVGANGEVDLAGGLLDTNILSLSDASSRLTGNGTVTLSGSFTNQGLIRPDGGTLTITNSVTLPNDFEIASANTGQVDVTAGNLTVNTPNNVKLGGPMTISAGRTASFNNGLHVTFISGASGVTLNGGTDANGKARLVTGGVLEINDQISVTGWADLDSDILLENERIVLSGSNARLELGAGTADTITVVGSDPGTGQVFAGNGTISQRGHLVVMPSGSLGDEGLIQTTTYDMDGGGASTLTVQGGYTLEIDAFSIDETAGDGYDGTATIEQGTLRINTHGIINILGNPVDVQFPWRLDGTLVMDSDATLEGSTMQVQGTVTANGSNNFIESPMTLLSAGTINVPTNATLTLRGGATLQGGTITGAGTLAQQGNITVTANTTIATGGFDWGNSLALVQPNVLTVASGVTLSVNSLGTLDADNKYRGQIVLNDGTLAVNTLFDWELPATSGSFPFIQARGELYLNDVGRGFAVVTGQDLVNNGLVSGVGVIDANLTNGGDVMPGHEGAAGILNVNGYYSQSPGGTLHIDLGGLTPGTGFDQLLIGNYASLPLGSVLDVSLINAFLPSIGNGFRVLNTGSFTLGAFGEVILPTIPGRGIGLLYDANGLTLMTGLQGDLNGDGFVGIEDLNIVLGAWNQTVFAGVWTLGDPTGDGFVGIADLNAVLGNWNAGTPPGAGATIPEPGTLACTAVLLSGLVVRRTRAGEAEKPWIPWPGRYT